MYFHLSLSVCVSVCHISIEKVGTSSRVLEALSIGAQRIELGFQKGCLINIIYTLLLCPPGNQ